MRDCPISLHDILAEDLPHAELVFLIMNDAARGSDVLDGVPHPAAWMMFAGFRSVIGTMWASDDGLGSSLVARFYEVMLEGKKNHTDAAVMLGDALEDVVAKDKDELPFMQRINLVHYGA